MIKTRKEVLVELLSNLYGRQKEEPQNKNIRAGIRALEIELSNILKRELKELKSD